MSLKAATNRFSAWFDIQGGQSYSRILKYFYPECITALIIYFLPYCINCLFICSLKSTNTYAISGIIENFLTQFLKAAEGLSVGIVILTGYHNGLSEFKKSGEAFVDSFWTVIGIGGLVSAGLYFLVTAICAFNNFSPEMIAEGIPYLQCKSISIFFMFVAMALVGFLRAIKNTFVPMVAFIIGAIVFVCVDYVLIFGAFGMPQMCLMGSAVAALVQNVVMSLVMFGYILYAKKTQKYEISFLKSRLNVNRTIKLLMVSLPVLIDKVSIAFGYAWLGSCMSHLGANAGAAFSCVKLMERFAFLPAMACAQVITFLVSNDVGSGRWEDIHANIKKVLVISVTLVGILLLIGSLWPAYFASFLDKKGEFGHLVAVVFPALSVLILIDLLQLVLSGALRGAGDVQTVMWTRVIVIGGFFIPATYLISWFSFDAIVTKMLATYAIFLTGNALMSMVYVYRLRQNHWKTQKQKVNNVESN